MAKVCEHNKTGAHLRDDRNYDPNRWCPGPTFDSWVESISNESECEEFCTYPVGECVQASRTSSITHADWELLAVDDCAPYHDCRYPKAGEARARAYEVLAELHKMLFGKTVEECGCDV